jgi:hypothetical protein
MKTKRSIITLAVLVAAQSASAQLPEAGTSIFSMAGNGIASARGFAAVAMNPANLGFSTNPDFSLNLITGGGTSGLDPVRLSDIAQFGGKLIPSATKEQWLQTIGGGTETGNINGGLSIIALSIAHVAFQAGIIATGDASLNQDAAEAIVFGNAGRTGSARNLSLNGSNANGSAFGTGAVSIGVPLLHTDHAGEFSIGVTGKYIVGLVSGRAMDAGSSVTPDSVNVQFPAVFTDSSHVGNAGSGIGVDVGLAWTNGNTSFSATARNVVNTFAWSTAAFEASLGSFSFNGATSSKHFDALPYASAPLALRSALEAEKFAPEIAVGFSHQAGNLLVAVDGSQRIGDGIDLGPKMHVGGGAEYVALGALALRAGAAAVTDGFQVAGGFGLRIGAYELGAGVSRRSRGSAQDTGVIVSLMSIR